MKLSIDELRKKISESGLKVTPQRMAILNAIYNLNNHPTAEQIIGRIHRDNPGIATGTVYNVLESLSEHALIRKVKTEDDKMRYEAIVERHHHLYCTECNFIEDYQNKELDQLLETFFKTNNIDNFIIDDVILQINGTFIKHKSKKTNR